MQHRDEGEGCAIMSETLDTVESLGAYVVDLALCGHFSWLVLCSFRLPSRTLVAYQKERGGMPLHDFVRVNCKKAAATDIKAHVPSICAKGFIGCLCEHYPT